MNKEICGFKIYKTKWYIINVLENYKTIDCQCDTKETAYDKIEELDRIEYKLYGNRKSNRFIVKGEQIPIWFY